MRIETGNENIAMDLSLNDEQRAWQMKARQFAQEEIAPISLQRDHIADPSKTFDWEIIRKGSKLGFRTAVVPKKWGGHGIDFVTQAVVMAELAKGDSAICKSFTQCWKWSHLIAAVCSDEQKERFLKPFIADDTFLLGKGTTEPSAGSDNRMPPDDPKAGLKLRAERHGDEWILNGDKTFIAHGNVAKLFFLDVRTDPHAGLRDGVTMFLVPRDTPGFRTGKVFNKNGWRFYQNTELIFENARVPHANVIGEVNGAYRKNAGDLTGGDLFGDLEHVGNALGVCEAACEQALDVARTETQGGKPLVDQQAIQLKLNRMHMLTEALRSFLLRIAWEQDQKMHSANGGLAMNFSCDVIQEVTELNLDIHDGIGGAVNGGALKLVQDAFIWSHTAGDSAQRLKVARKVIKLK